MILVYFVWSLILIFLVLWILVAFFLSRSNNEYRNWRNEQLRQSIIRSKK